MYVFVLYRVLLSQSEENERTMSQLRDEIISLNDNKSMIEAELQSVHSELKQQNMMCTELRKVVNTVIIIIIIIMYHLCAFI